MFQSSIFRRFVGFQPRATARENTTSTSVPVFAAALEVELRAVGFDQRLGQRQADAGGIVGRLIRRRGGAERFERRCDFVVIEPGTGIAHPQHHLAEIRQRGRDDDLACGIGKMDRVADQSSW